MLRAYYYSYFFRTKFDALLLLHRLSQTHETGVKSCGPIEEWCAMTFISDRAYDDRTAGDKTAEKSHRQRIAANFDES